MSVEEHDDKVSMAMYDASVVGIVSCLAGSAAITRLLSSAVCFVACLISVTTASTSLAAVGTGFVVLSELFGKESGKELFVLVNVCSATAFAVMSLFADFSPPFSGGGGIVVSFESRIMFLYPYFKVFVFALNVYSTSAEENDDCNGKISPGVCILDVSFFNFAWFSIREGYIIPYTVCVRLLFRVALIVSISKNTPPFVRVTCL